MTILDLIASDAFPPPSLDELEWARARFQELEPRDLFYRVASSLVAGLIDGTQSEFTRGDAVAVLLMSWNSSYYRFRRPDPSHLVLIDKLVDEHWPWLMSMRSLRIEALGAADYAAIRPRFEQFDQLLGPVGAAKALHLLAPAVFPIWDRAISIAYGCHLGPRGTNGSLYAAFMDVTARQCRVLTAVVGAPADMLKALDEWNYVRYTRGLWSDAEYETLFGGFPPEGRQPTGDEIDALALVGRSTSAITQQWSDGAAYCQGRPPSTRSGPLKFWLDHCGLIR